MCNQYNWDYALLYPPWSELEFLLSFVWCCHAQQLHSLDVLRNSLALLGATGLYLVVHRHCVCLYFKSVSMFVPPYFCLKSTPMAVSSAFSVSNSFASSASSVSSHRWKKITSQKCLAMNWCDNHLTLLIKTHSFLRQQRNLINVTSVARRRRDFWVFLQFFCCWTPSKERCHQGIGARASKEHRVVMISKYAPSSDLMSSQPERWSATHSDVSFRTK